MDARRDDEPGLNEEGADGAVTTVTFEDKGGKTLLVLHERYPSKEALDASIEGMEGGMPKQFAQLDELLVTLDGNDAAPPRVAAQAQ
jgi:uncharacterized protein YndB with AHSA1/START domain